MKSSPFEPEGWGQRVELRKGFAGFPEVIL